MEKKTGSSNSQAKHGGTRPGAGKKPVYHLSKRKITYFPDEDLVEFLEECGNKNRTINLAVRSYKKKIESKIEEIDSLE